MDIKVTAISTILLALTSAPAFAAENNAGKIHFTGQIVEPSCVIEGDTGTDSTVDLGTWVKSTFGTIGAESSLAPFIITLKDCPVTSDGLPMVQLTFNGTTTETGSDTLLDVSKITTEGTTAATGVGIAVSEEGSDTTLIKMDGTEGQVFIPLPSTAGTSITASLNARYKSYAAAVTAGPADADMTINIVYH
ncbi:fimbrial protein [Kluyvera sp. STS39-E]|uniref:fimbrial protein n=1 Tax=Kluyvera sp. STS39-E TaxID=3234748 RepID=UPI0034C64D71